MSAAEEHLGWIRDALKDGPLSPRELRAATGLSRHQIGRAGALADDQSHADTSTPVIVYSATHRLWIETNNGVEIARALRPQLKGQVTRCSRVIEHLKWIMQNIDDTDEDPDFVRSMKVAEAHRQQAEDYLEMIEKAIASAE